VHIRIIDVTSKNVDIIIDDPKPGVAENHKLIPRKLLDAYLDDWLSFVKRVLAEKNSRPEDKAFDREVVDKLQRYGKTLHTMLFSAGWNVSAARTLSFSVDAPWASLPFELLPTHHERENFAGLRIPIVRQMRTVGRTFGASERTKTKAQRLLLLANLEGATDLASVAELEKKSLARTVDRAENLKILGKLSNTAQIVDEMVHCSYMHYSGHIRDQGLQFSQDTLSSPEIAALNLENIKLAFINGCNSAGKHDKNGLAWAFLTAGTQNYIGYNHPVSDQVALFAADFVWSRFFPKNKLAAKIISATLFRKKFLADVAVSLRRAIFEKFGAGELAWLSIQFFINPQEHPRRRGLRLISAAIAVGLGIFSVAFLFRPASQPAPPKTAHAASGKISEPLQATVQKSKNPTQATDAKTVNQMSIAIEPKSSDGKQQSIDSPVLADLVMDFRKTQHPFYSKEDKERILTEILNMPVSESSKIIRLRNEMP